MWPFTRQPKPEPPREVMERLDTLDDSFQHLERRFIRLQQQFTRLVRELETMTQYDLEDDDEDVDDDILAEIDKRRHA